MGFFPSFNVFAITALFNFLLVVSMHTALEIADALAEPASEFGNLARAEEDDDYE